MISTFKSCPWCGGSASMYIEPMWHGSHGYQGNYLWEVRCSNCGATAPHGKFDDIYYPKEQAEAKAAKVWNTRNI